MILCYFCLTECKEVKMEKIKNCAECGIEFKYEAPTNYPDKRKYCFRCSEEKKAQWENKDAGKVLQETQQGERSINGQAQPPTKEKSIVAQCLTKAFVTSKYEDPKAILDAYNYFLSEL